MLLNLLTTVEIIFENKFKSIIDTETFLELMTLFKTIDLLLIDGGI